MVYINQKIKELLSMTISVEYATSRNITLNNMLLNIKNWGCTYALAILYKSIDSSLTTSIF